MFRMFSKPLCTQVHTQICILKNLFKSIGFSDNDNIILTSKNLNMTTTEEDPPGRKGERLVPGPCQGQRTSLRPSPLCAVAALVRRRGDGASRLLHVSLTLRQVSADHSLVLQPGVVPVTHHGAEPEKRSNPESS